MLSTSTKTIERSHAKLDLKTLLARVYDAKGFEEDLYASPPELPQREADKDWVQAVVAPAGYRACDAIGVRAGAFIHSQASSRANA